MCGAISAVAQTLTLMPEDDALRDRLQGEAAVFSLAPDARPDDVIATAQGDYGRLLAVLYDAGYFGAVISIRLGEREAATLNTFDTPGGLRPIRIEIDLGRPFRFGTARVQPLPVGATLPDGFAPGAPAGTGTIQQAGQAAVDLWRDASHAKARLTGQDIVARHPDATLDVTLTVDPGPALRFGTFVVPEGAEVRAERLRAIGGLPAGAAFDPATVQRVRPRLVRTGAFNSVVVREADEPNPNGTLDIILDVEAAPQFRIGFGAEVEARDGISLEAFWLNRNVYGGAERLRFDFDLDGIGADTGGIDVGLGGRLSIPGFRRPDDTLEIFTTLERLNEVTFRSSAFELGVRRERQLRGDELVIGVGASLRFSDTEDALGSRQFRHVVIDWDVTRDRRDDPLDARDGTYAALTLRPFVGVTDNSGTGVRVTGDFRAYRAISDRLVLAGRLQFGSVLGSAQGDTPPEFLFFSGGGGTVRGQSFQSLGVDTAAGVIGGRGFVGASVELRRDVTDTIGVVGFVDVGYVSESGTFEDGDSHAGVGLGLRYRTALGPIRADIGLPVGGNPRNDFGIFIGIGQAF